MMPQFSPFVPMRYWAERALRRSLVKKVSVCGPCGMSMHSVSRGGATVGRIMTRMVGCILPSFESLCAVCG